MTEPTETEVEAMAKVIGDKAVELARGKWEIEWPWLRDPDSNAAVDLRELARAALTAAAQVRERAPDTLEPLVREFLAAERAVEVEGNRAEKAGGGWSSGPTVRRIYALKALAAALAPTEPDSGPSVLGNEE